MCDSDIPRDNWIQVISPLVDRHSQSFENKKRISIVRLSPFDYFEMVVFWELRLLLSFFAAWLMYRLPLDLAKSVGIVDKQFLTWDICVEVVIQCSNCTQPLVDMHLVINIIALSGNW